MRSLKIHRLIQLGEEFNLHARDYHCNTPCGAWTYRFFSVTEEVWKCVPAQAQCRTCAKASSRRQFASDDQVVAVEYALFGIAKVWE